MRHLVGVRRRLDQHRWPLHALAMAAVCLVPAATVAMTSALGNAPGTPVQEPSLAESLADEPPRGCSDDSGNGRNDDGTDDGADDGDGKPSKGSGRDKGKRQDGDD